jgi:chemotaxis protein methyltransferase CheR
MSNGLRDALATLRASIAEHRAALLRSAPTEALQAAAAAGREAMIGELTAEVRQRFGLVLEQRIETKLAQVLQSVSEVDLARWIGSLAFLPSDHAEWLAVIETLTVHESFFFRDSAQLDSLQALLVRDLHHGPPREIRLWSAGCSGGEEAYTLAIVACLARVECGLATEGPGSRLRFKPGWSVRVIGTDISRPVLRQAETGFYPAGVPGPFREIWPELLRFLPEVGDGARQVHEDFRGLVTFYQGNLLGPNPNPITTPEHFDVVVCRNVMIYQDEKARTLVQCALFDALKPDGYLLLGPTDTLTNVDFFTPIWDKSSLVYRKKKR